MATTTATLRGTAADNNPMSITYQITMPPCDAKTRCVAGSTAR